MSEGELPHSVPPRKSRFKKIFLILVIVIALGLIADRIWYLHTFPYGWSHACSKALGMNLYQYAADHEHWLPHGEKTPEASLGLLYKEDTNTAVWMLSGKNIPHDRVAAAIKAHGNVSPETCGWHYIEGLRDDDDSQIAVAWDKPIGLWHNGQRRTELMHEVVLLDGSTLFINKSYWPEFIINEKKLLATAAILHGSNAPAIRWSDQESLGPNHPLPQ